MWRQKVDFLIYFRDFRKFLRQDSSRSHRNTLDTPRWRASMGRLSRLHQLFAKKKELELLLPISWFGPSKSGQISAKSMWLSSYDFLKKFESYRLFLIGNGRLRCDSDFNRKWSHDPCNTAHDLTNFPTVTGRRRREERVLTAVVKTWVLIFSFWSFLSPLNITCDFIVNIQMTFWFDLLVLA